MRRKIAQWLVSMVCGAAMSPFLSGARSADAGCNLIPGTAKTFNSTLGSTNRPFAAPGETLEVAIRPCDTASLGLTANPANHVVTVLFTPPTGPSRQMHSLNDGTSALIASTRRRRLL